MGEFYQRFKEPIDHAVHTGIGFALTMLLTFYIPREAAFGFMLLAAYFREAWQHRGFDLDWGSVIDLVFFAIGGTLVWSLPEGLFER